MTTRNSWRTNFNRSRCVLSWDKSKQGAGLRSSYYHCPFFFFDRGYVIKRSIYARQYDIPPGQFIEHPRGYVNVTRVKIRNIEDRSRRAFFSNDRPNLLRFDKSHRRNFEKCLETCSWKRPIFPFKYLCNDIEFFRKSFRIVILEII